jgi:uncharacterized protein YfdQ (DUF2303 family)
MNQVVESARASMEIQRRVCSIEHNGVEVPCAIVGGNVVVLDAAVKFVDERMTSPRSRVVNANAEDLASLVAYVNRQKLEGQTVAFAAKSPAPKVVVAIDWHRAAGGEPGWFRDRVTYAPALSRQFVAWTGLARAQGGVGQDAFADFLEDNLDDVAEKGDSPKKLELVKMARDLHVSVGSKFQRSVDPSTGDVQLVSTADSGQSKTKIPREFLLGIPVFDGSDVLYAIRVGLKLELRGSEAYFHVKPRNADLALDDAFGDVKKAVAEQCEIPVFAGTP